MAAVTEQMLTEARQALHRLMTGASVAEFRDQNSEVVRYTQVNRNALIQYIKWLEAELGLNTIKPTGPMGVWM